MCSTPPAIAMSYAADTDSGGHNARGGHCPGTHAIDRETWCGFRQTREECGGSAEGEALVTDLSGRGNGDLFDAIPWEDLGCGE